MDEKIELYIKQVTLPLKDIFNDMLKYAPSKVFALLGNAVIVPVYTNLLSPSQYGVYTISLAVLSFLCIIFSDWIGLSALRFFRINQLNDKIPKYLTTLIFMLICNLLFMYLAVGILRNNFYLYFNIQPQILLFVLLLIIPVSIRALLFQVLRAQIKPGAFTVSSILNQIMTIGIAYYLLNHTNLQAISILIAMAISITIIDLILLYQSNICKYFEPTRPDLTMSRSIITYGIPIAMASTSMWIINQSNKFITNHYYGLSDAGLVGVAYNMTFPILMTFFAIITIAAFPRIINLYEDKVDTRPLLSKITGYFMIIALPAVVFISIYSQTLITLFANSKYQDAYILLPFFALSAFFLSFADYTTMQYHLANKTYIIVIQKILAGILGLVLNIILIKKYGLPGVGAATLASNAFYFILTLFMSIKDLEWIIPIKKILHILTAFLPTALLIVLLKSANVIELVQMPLVILCYYLSFYYLRKIFKDALPGV